jgi:hypothetical protein
MRLCYHLLTSRLQTHSHTGAALTVPSALHLIVHLYTDPVAQSKAIAVFGASAALGNSELWWSVLTRFENLS